MTLPSMPARVVKPYTAQYPDPIELRTGNPVSLGKRDPEFPGWIWATSSISGKSGWVPEQFLSAEDGDPRALRDYSAQLLGWALVETQDGARGWLPQSRLARGVSPSHVPL